MKAESAGLGQQSLHEKKQFDVKKQCALLLSEHLFQHYQQVALTILVADPQILLSLLNTCCHYSSVQTQIHSVPQILLQCHFKWSFFAEPSPNKVINGICIEFSAHFQS